MNMNDELKMNTREADVLLALCTLSKPSQRMLAQKTKLALGSVNQALRRLQEYGFYDGVQLTALARAELLRCRPKRAVILAAGFGMRMVPINMETPKALVQVHGETLIERQIKQLHAAGIRNISVVVGFMKEQFEYLIDRYGVRLLVNADYARKNNLSSLALADNLENCYVVPGDVYCAQNPFHRRELYSWYMVSDRRSAESMLRVNRRNRLVYTEAGERGNAMIGIAYLCKMDGALLADRLRRLAQDSAYDARFWEAALLTKQGMDIVPRLADAGQVMEINTYEQLRRLDADSEQLESGVLKQIARILHCKVADMHAIAALKKGMTNRSFVFTVHNERYIMRIPGAGTEKLINRRQEAAVYRAIEGKGICDAPLYLNPKTGYKLSRYIDKVRACDPFREDDLVLAMRTLRRFHDMHLQVDHVFDLFGQIAFYEQLRNGRPSVYRDYAETRRHIFALQEYLFEQNIDCCLTHIDAVPDNFLIDPKAEGGMQLTDWEYAGMQDPYVDLAMFSIYSFYDRRQIDHLLDLYFTGKVSEEIRTRIYCYVAVCGLLWSNWCEYKTQFGVDFGAYNLRQYRYAKEYYRLVEKRIGKKEK